MLMSLTMPGTLTTETPEMDVPIMPKATSHQGLLRSPRKKALLSLLREVKWDISNRRPK